MPALRFRFAPAALLALGAGAVAVHAGAAPVTACAGEHQFPPLTMRVPGEPARLRGETVSLLTDLLAEAKLGTLDLRQLPWQRCLRAVEQGEIAIAVDVPTAQVRPTPFLITPPYAFVRSAYVYARARFPQGLAIEKLDDLERFQLCGLAGLTYEGYGIATARVQGFGRSYRQLFALLTAGRCEVVLDKLEVLQHLDGIDSGIPQYLQEHGLVVAPLPDEPLGLHFIVGRRHARADAIFKALASAMQARQQARRLPLDLVAPPSWYRTAR